MIFAGKQKLTSPESCGATIRGISTVQHSGKTENGRRLCPHPYHMSSSIFEDYYTTEVPLKNKNSPQDSGGANEAGNFVLKFLLKFILLVYGNRTKCRCPKTSLWKVICHPRFSGWVSSCGLLSR